jgi:hypothetical protein
MQKNGWTYFSGCDVQLHRLSVELQDLLGALHEVRIFDHVPWVKKI